MPTPTPPPEPPDDATRTSFGAPAANAPGRSITSSFTTSLAPAGGALIPGQLVTERYRIVARLGAGAMGEVYRADDLRLGQTVALKFLPVSLASDPRRVTAFRNEVRVAREVTHPNVCRVHDLGEVDGQLFLSMEYIDGEDLSSLLRRIGRVPPDKAVEIARQVCAGLAAAHERGVLHRDLKPGNIMIDGRGRARLTDFGLAALAGDVTGADVRSGTPVYMAPEQLAGREVTSKSDLYALGLVLYELFTGRPAFKAQGTVRDLLAARESSEIPAPSTLVSDLDAGVERVILRCLEPDPASRPASALAVAASLPGGDPLAAALAAGETPSPELVAAAGGTDLVPLRRAWSWLAVALLGLLGVLALTPSVAVLGVAPLPKPPEVLAERARDIVHLAGYDLRAFDSARGLSVDGAWFRWLQATTGGRVLGLPSLRGGRLTPVSFWYRQHTAALEPVDPTGEVTLLDPPVVNGGMASVTLAPDGTLRELQVPPPEKVEAAAAHAPADWTPLLRAAGFDPAALTPVPPDGTPPFFADEQAAWTAAPPAGLPGGTTIRAAAFRGRPTWFSVIEPGMQPHRGRPAEENLPTSTRIAAAIGATVLLLTLLSASVMARRNLRSGRGDRRGAFRIGLAAFGITFATQLLATQPPTGLDASMARLFGAAAPAAMIGGIVWLVYLALEPIIRRSRPESLVGWTRLLSGRVRDPRVGRDVLVGSALGAAILLVGVLLRAVPAWLGQPAPLPMLGGLSAYAGTRFMIARLLGNVLNAITSALLMMFFVGIAVRRREASRIGIAIFVTITMLLLTLQINPPALLLSLPLLGVFVALYTMTFVRYGVVAGVAALLLMQWSTPLVLDPTNWTFGPTLVMAALLAAVPVAGFWIAMGGRSPFGQPTA